MCKIMRKIKAILRIKNLPSCGDECPNCGSDDIMLWDGCMCRDCGYEW